MVKDNSNANGDGNSADVHLVLNGKAGVGQVVRVLREAGRNIYLHVPITGGETLSDTLLWVLHYRGSFNGAKRGRPGQRIPRPRCTRRQAFDRDASLRLASG